MIKNVNSGLYIDIDGAKVENGTSAQQWGASGAAVQNTFKLISAGEGYYYIVSAVGDGGTYVLDISGRKTANGTNICVYQYNGGDNQKFKFVKNVDGSYKIKSKITGDKSCIEVADAAKSSGANVRQWDSNGLNCQKWTLQEFAGGGNYYYIRSCQDYSFVLKAEGNQNGGNMDIVTYSNKDSSMLFRFSKNPNGSYHIITHASKDKAYVEVASSSKSSGANVQQWEPNGNDCQKWYAVPRL